MSPVIYYDRSRTLVKTGAQFLEAVGWRLASSTRDGIDDAGGEIHFADNIVIKSPMKKSPKHRP